MKKTYGARVMDKQEGFLRPIYFPALTFMDVKTGDGRFLESAGGGTRDLPLTIWAQFEQGPGGHVGAVIAGTLHELTFHEDGLVSGSGWVLDDDNGRKVVMYAQTQALRGNSADLADIKARYEWDEEADDISIVFSEWNIAGTTIVGRPAFKDARYSLDDELVASWMSSEDPIVIDVPTKINVLVAEPELAADGLKRPSWDFFHAPEPDEPQPLRISEPDADGFQVVTAHLALWNTCHDGYDRCIIPPRPTDNYAGFNSASVLTDKGLVATGPLFLRGGHPKAGELAKKSVEECYGSTENAWSDVRVIAGRLGPWLSGYVRPGVSEDLVIAARASKLSGHWLGGRLMAACSVNVPGYEVPGGESFSLDADGMVAELVAGMLPCATEDASTIGETISNTPHENNSDDFDIDAIRLEMERQDLLAE